MSNNYKTNTSLVKVLKKIINTEINNNSKKTTIGKLLYLAGSDLTPVTFGKLSY